MTTLTPPSAAQCALIDEAARQQKSGESDAHYWNWSSSVSGSNGFYKNNFDDRYYPAPAHPHYAKYIEWTRLVDAGEVAKGWWNVLTWHSVVGTSCYTPEPKWFPDFDYEIRKTDKHPDNCKLKLIDWAKVPVGAMTNEGEVVQIGNTALLTIKRMDGWFKCYVFGFEKLRLLEQTTLTHLPAGTPPPVVEGLVFDYEYVEVGFTAYRGVGKPYRSKYKIVQEFTGDPYALCVGYRVIGCAPGYTDNPELAH